MVIFRIIITTVSIPPIDPEEEVTTYNGACPELVEGMKTATSFLKPIP